ncbi:exportin-4-like [Saccostrea echinata]|uniref:exportin-4-like n=1 Tax=Saccostrea echinata TaxID=191078 RepID=UPI002A82F0EE|nr:exportin-4-like [Saccostrea echinata]
MAEKILQELESASQIALAPPDIVTSEQRHAAEAVILEFRKTKLPYNLCKFILENSKCDYVLFQAATTIKESVIREWTLLEAMDIESLRSFLLRFITQHITLKSYVREQILQTVAVILKRGEVDVKGASRDNMFQDITNLVSSGNVTMQLVACSMLTALLNEFSSSSRTSNVGFTWEFHSKCKKAFEENDLKRVFLFALQVLYEIERQPSPLSRETTAVLNRLLSITDSVLCWEFTPKLSYRRHVGSFEMNENVSLKPDESWRTTLLDKNMLQLFFNIHKKVRHNSDMSHHSITCLSQLASLNGIIFPDDKARLEYLTAYISGFLELLSCIDLQDYENLGVASTFKNLILMFPISLLEALPRELLTSFINHMTRLTCDVGKNAAMEEALHKDDTIYMEAYEKMLETWMDLVTNMKDLPMEVLYPQSQEVFNIYVQCHISAPEGTRIQNGMDAYTDADEVDEIEEDDRERFADQLSSIGILGRLAPEHCVPLLAKILENRVSRLHGHLHRLQQQSAATQNCLLDASHLNSLYEDLHWIVLISTHVLTEECEGETPMIPSDIMEYSICQTKKTDLSTTMKVLASPGQSIESIPGSDISTDPVIRLISAVFRLCEVEKQAINAKMSHVLSPQVGSSVMCFLRRWARAYLLPDETYYTNVSPALFSAFGRDTDGAQWTVSFLLDKIISNIAIWTAEEALVEDTLQFLVSLVEQRQKARYLTKCELLWNIAKQEANHQPPLSLLPSKPRRSLLKALVLAGSGVEEDTLREGYWNCVLKSLHDRFHHLLSQENFARVAQVVGVKTALITMLESLCGVAEGTRIDNLQRLFTFFLPILQECVRILDTYHNCEDVVPLVIELFNEVVNKQLCYLGESDSRKLYELCLTAIQMYSKHNAGRRTVSDEEEEDRYNDILLTMELLTNLLSKDFIDFSDPAEEVFPQNGEQVSAADVVLFGLNTIIPLMNEDLLAFPTLCAQYFKLVTFLAEIHPDKFSSLPENLLNSLMASVELGLSRYGSDISRMSLEIITSLASHVFQTNQSESILNSHLANFLKQVFNMLLLETFNMELLEVSSTALFCLICCHQDGYRELVNQLLQHQTDPQYRERLLEAFTNLTPPSLNMTINRTSKIAFMSNFGNFLINVRGFLCVK